MSRRPAKEDGDKNRPTVWDPKLLEVSRGAWLLSSARKDPQKTKNRRVVREELRVPAFHLEPCRGSGVGVVWRV